MEGRKAEKTDRTVLNEHLTNNGKERFSGYLRYFWNNENERPYKLDGGKKSGNIGNSRLQDAWRSELTITSVGNSFERSGKGRRFRDARRTEENISNRPEVTEDARGSHFASVFKVRDNLTDKNKDADRRQSSPVKNPS